MSIRKILTFAPVAFALALSGSAIGEQTYSGAICLSSNAGADPLSHNAFTSNSTATTATVVCPTSTDQAIGNARWTARVTDGSTTQGFTCIGIVSDANGNSVAVSSAGSTTNAFTGSTTLTMTTTSGGFASSFSHTLHCTIPGNNGAVSGIFRITLD